MRKVFVAVALLMMSVGLSFAQEAKSKTKAGGDVKQHIEQIMDEGRQAALKGDTSWSEKYMADNYESVTATGERIDSKSDAISRMKSGKVKYESIDVEDKDVRAYGDSAVYSGRAKLKATRDGQDISGDYRGTWFWAKQGGQWKLVASQSTKVMGEGSK